MTSTPLLDGIASTDDLRRLPESDLQRLATELLTQKFELAGLRTLPRAGAGWGSGLEEWPGLGLGL